jgi:hypothetical protein
MVVDDDDPHRARHVAAAGIAWYVCGMGDRYSQYISAQGFGDDVRAILDANPAPKPASCVIPPEAEHLIDQFAAAGTSSQVRTQLEAWDAVADIVAVAPTAQMSWPEIETMIRTAAP